MNSNNSGGFPLVAILGVVFVTLKLIGTITWPWLWVTAPFWGPFGALVMVGLAAMPSALARQEEGR